MTDDTISRQAAKDYIDSQKGRPFIGCTIGEAMKIMLDEVPPETEQFDQGYERGFKAGRKVVKPWKWNPCSEEMPQKDERYIVTVRDIFDNIKVQFRYWNADCNLWSGDQMDEVLAWCEIPEPWEGAQDDGET